MSDAPTPEPTPVDPKDETVALPDPSAAREEAETVELPDRSSGATVDPVAPELPETLLTSDAEEVEPDEPLGTIGPYELRELLGRGGMGRVYRAFHPGLERDVALKLLTAQGNPEHTRRFGLEARAAARLKHRHIVAIHDVGEDAGRPYLVMDLVAGRSLGERLSEEKRLPPREAAALTRDVARALAHAHSHMVLHRDIKPANIMLTAEGEPRLTDFGLAKDLSADGTLTETGVIMGTPAYMPPEQARGALEAIDRRADIYALGASLYEMLTGDPPFTGESALSVIHKLLRNEPVAPRSLRPELDPDLETICLRCLEKEPEARYPTASDLADDLERYLEHRTITARPPTPTERIRKWVRRNRTLARGVGATVAAAGVIGLIGTLVFVINLDRERDRADAAKTLAEQREAEAKAATALAKLREAEANAARTLAERRRTEAAEQARLAGESLDALIFEVRNELAGLPGQAVRGARMRLLSKALDGLLRLAPGEGDTLRAASVYRQQAEIAFLLGRVDVADKACARALAAVGEDRSLRARRGRAAMRLLRALIRQRQGRLPAALKEARAVAASIGPAETDGDLRRVWARAQLRVSSLLRQQGKPVEARGPLESALAALVKETAGSQRERLRGEILGQLHDLCYDLGDLPAAKRFGHEALKISRARHASEPEASDLALQLVDSLNALGRTAMQQEDTPAAAGHFRESLELSRKLSARDPKDTQIASSFLAALGGYAQVMERTGRVSEGAAMHNDVVKGARALLKVDPSDTSAGEALVVSLLALGQVETMQWKLETSERRFAEARAAARRLAELDPSDARARSLEVGAAAWESIVQLRLGKVEAARAAAEHAVKESRLLLKRDPRLASAGRALAVGLGQLAGVHERLAEDERALELYGAAVTEIRRLLAIDSTHARLKRNLAAALASAGQLHHRAGRLVEAETSTLAALKAIESMGAHPHQRSVNPQGLRRYLQRIRAERSRLAALREGEEPRTAVDHWLLARALSAKTPAQALPHYRAALLDRGLRSRPQPSVLAWAARAAARAGQVDEALSWLGELARNHRALIPQFTAAVAQGKLDPPTRRKYLEVRDKLQAQLRRLAVDPAFASLRKTAAFKALFPNQPRER